MQNILIVKMIFLKKILLNDMVDVYIKLINFLNGQMAVLLTFLKLLIYMDVQMVYPIVSLNWRCKKNLLWNKI